MLDRLMLSILLQRRKRFVLVKLFLKFLDETIRVAIEVYVDKLSVIYTQLHCQRFELLPDFMRHIDQKIRYM